MTIRWRPTSTTPRGCYLGFNFIIIESTYAIMGACCFRMMLENWKNVQYVVPERWFMRKIVRGRKIPKKVFINFPFGPRLQRLYATKNVAEHMTWHHEHQRTDNFMEHPSDAKGWKHFDTMFHELSSEPQNVRLGLCTDGFVLFSHYGQSYSCWLVIVTPYNPPL